MEEIKKDLRGKRTYAWLMVGTFVGIAVVMAAIRFVPSFARNASVNNVNSANQIVEGVDKNNVSESYQKALENPTEPYTDAYGVTHPPIGVAPVPVTASTKVEHLPAGGTATTKTSSTAPAPTPAPAPTIKLPTVQVVPQQ